MKGWEIKALGEVADCCLGKMLDKAKNRGTPRPYLRNINVRWFGFDLSDLLEMPFEKDEFDRYSAIAGDVLICEGGYPGRAAIWEANEPIFFQKAIHRVRFGDRDRAKWLVYYLWFLDVSGQLKSHFTGAGIQHFTGQALKRLRIPLPPLDEQRRIVAILDEAFAGLAVMRQHAEANLKNARALFDSHLNAIFSQRGDGWVETTIEKIAFIKGGKRVPKGYSLLSEKTDFPYLRVTDFGSNGTIEIDDLRYIDASVHRQIKNYTISSDDIYVSIAGTIGKTGIVPRHLSGSLLTENACRLVFKENVFNKFVYYFTKSSRFSDLCKYNTRVSTQPKLALSRLATIGLSVPSLKKQHELASEFDSISIEVESLEALYRQKLTAIDELKQAILHRAFSGELSAKDALAA